MIALVAALPALRCRGLHESIRQTTADAGAPRRRTGRCGASNRAAGRGRAGVRRSAAHPSFPFGTGNGSGSCQGAESKVKGAGGKGPNCCLNSLAGGCAPVEPGPPPPADSPSKSPPETMAASPGAWKASDCKTRLGSPAPLAPTGPSKSPCASAPPPAAASAKTLQTNVNSAGSEGPSTAATHQCQPLHGHKLDREVCPLLQRALRRLPLHWRLHRRQRLPRYCKPA